VQPASLALAVTRPRTAPLDWRRAVPLLLAAPLLIYMLVFYALPVVAMLLRSVNDPTWTLANYATLLDDIVFQKTFWITINTSVTVTLGCLILGYPVAMGLVRAKSMAPLILVIILLPFWTSVLVRSYAWMVLLGRHGLVNEALLALGMIDRPIRILNTPLATQIAMIHILLPYMILPIANALRQIDPSLIRGRLRPWRDAVHDLPSGHHAAFDVGVAAGTLLTFVLALGFYITPAMVGGPRDITLSMLIAQQVEQLNWAYAATLSAVLLATALAILAAARKLPGARQRLQNEHAMKLGHILPASVVGLILFFLAFPSSSWRSSPSPRRPISRSRRPPFGCAGTRPISATPTG
jgi:ABC-type spermidine/putrescine transport system permease subunit I